MAVDDKSVLNVVAAPPVPCLVLRAAARKPVRLGRDGRPAEREPVKRGSVVAVMVMSFVVEPLRGPSCPSNDANREARSGFRFARRGGDRSNGDTPNEGAARFPCTSPFERKLNG